MKNKQEFQLNKIAKYIKSNDANDREIESYILPEIVIAAARVTEQFFTF